MKTIELKNVSKVYPNGVKAMDNVLADVRKLNFITSIIVLSCVIASGFIIPITSEAEPWDFIQQ